MSKINQLREKIEIRLQACNLITVFLVAVLIVLLCLLSNEAHGQKQSTFDGEGISNKIKESTIQQKLIRNIGVYLKDRRVNLTFSNRDSIFIIQLQPLTMKVDTVSFRQGAISLLEIDSLLKSITAKNNVSLNSSTDYLKNVINILHVNNKSVEKTKAGVFFISVLIILILLTVSGIRYFILLAVHYRSRADALSLIGDSEKLSVEDAITLTSASNIDFRISKHTKNELIEIFNLKAETKKAEEMSKVKCCCCTCSQERGHKDS